MALIYLLIAGALEVAWATGLKTLGVAPSWSLGVMTGAAMIASLAALYAAMTHIPLGIAYPVWTGIGSVGSVLIGVMIFNQTLSLANMAGLGLLVAGMFLLGSDAH